MAIYPDDMAVSDDGFIVYLTAGIIDGKLYRSVNEATSFNDLGTSFILNMMSVACSGDGSIVYVADWDTNLSTGHFHISTDFGDTFIDTGLAGGGAPSGIACSADGTIVYIIDYSEGWLYTSTDSGATFSGKHVTVFPSTIACSSDGTIVYVTGRASDALYKSVDSGATFVDTLFAADLDPYSLSCSSDGLIVYMTSNTLDKLHKSTDGAVSFVTTDSPDDESFHKSATTGDGSTVYYVGDQIFKSVDGGTTLIALPEPLTLDSSLPPVIGSDSWTQHFDGDTYGTLTAWFPSDNNNWTVTVSGYRGVATGIDLEYILGGQYSDYYTYINVDNKLCIRYGEDVAVSANAFDVDSDFTFTLSRTAGGMVSGQLNDGDTFSVLDMTSRPNAISRIGTYGIETTDFVGQIHLIDFIDPNDGANSRRYSGIIDSELIPATDTAIVNILDDTTSGTWVFNTPPNYIKVLHSVVIPDSVNELQYDGNYVVDIMYSDENSELQSVVINMGSVNVWTPAPIPEWVLNVPVDGYLEIPTFTAGAAFEISGNIRWHAASRYYLGYNTALYTDATGFHLYVSGQRLAMNGVYSEGQLCSFTITRDVDDYTEFTLNGVLSTGTITAALSVDKIASGGNNDVGAFEPTVLEGVLVLDDKVNRRTYDFSASGNAKTGSGQPIVLDTTSGYHATGVKMSTDDSNWSEL